MNKTIAIASLAIFAAVPAALAADAKANWGQYCAKCHGADGKGQTKMGQKLGIKDYTDAKVQAEFSDEEALKAIREGSKDKNGKTLMKPVEGLAPEEMEALVQYIRAFKA